MIDIERSALALMMECGYVLVGMQRFAEAREVFEGVAVMAADSEIPIVALGSVAFCEGKFKESAKHYHKALKLNAQSAFAKAYLGEALFFMGDTPAAMAELQTALRLDPSGKAGGFAKALLDAIDQGFTPHMIAGTDDTDGARPQAARKEAPHVS